MVQINFAQKSVTVKVVYYGPGMSGKTTNLEVVHQRAPEASRGDLTSISTDGDRTLFFDFMPLDLGTVAGMRTQFQIYTVPGQVYYNSTRKLVLQGVDGVVFVADSSASMVDENLESLRNLEENLAEYGKSLKEIPIIMQYNKRDLPDALPVEELDRLLNPMGAPAYEAVANTGQGVFPTLKALASCVLESIHKQSGSGSTSSMPKPAAEAPATPSMPATPAPTLSMQPPPEPAQPAQAAQPAPPVQPAAQQQPSMPQPAAAQMPAAPQSAGEPLPAIPALPPTAVPEEAAPASQPPVAQAATGFYKAPEQAAASPPVQSAGTGFYPASAGVPGAQNPSPPQSAPMDAGQSPAMPQASVPTPEPAAPEAAPAWNDPSPSPTAQAGTQAAPGVQQQPDSQGFQQSSSFPAPNQLHQTGFHPVQPSSMPEPAPAPAPAPAQEAPSSFQSSSYQPAPASQQVAPGPTAAPRIRPRGHATPSSPSSSSNSKTTTVAIMVIAVGIGVVIGGLAFGLF